MFDTIIKIIEWGNFIGILVLIVLYFTAPIILRKYVFKNNDDKDDLDLHDGDTIAEEGDKDHKSEEE